MTFIYALLWKTEIENLFKFQNNVNYAMNIFWKIKKDKELRTLEIVLL
jgi:hypothetical protein